MPASEFPLMTSLIKIAGAPQGISEGREARFSAIRTWRPTCLSIALAKAEHTKVSNEATDFTMWATPVKSFDVFTRI